jgi:hypothetical protein
LELEERNATLERDVTEGDAGKEERDIPCATEPVHEHVVKHSTSEKACSLLALNQRDIPNNGAPARIGRLHQAAVVEKALAEGKVRDLLWRRSNVGHSECAVANHADSAAQRLRSLAGPAARNVMSRKTVMPAR